MKSLLSILTLYNYDDSVFDNLLLPAGVEKEDIVNNLLLELAELEIIYPSFDTMKSAIGFWSKKEMPVWEKMYATTQFEYEALENLWRTEQMTDTETRNLTGSNNETRNLIGSDNETRNLGGTNIHHSETDGETTNSGTDTQKDYVSAFNDGDGKTLKGQEEQTLGTSNVVTGNVDSDTTTTDTGTVNKASTEGGTVNHTVTDTGTVTKANTTEMHGSIGVITPQDMIEKERRVSQFNINNYIIDSFKSRFCLLVY